MAERPFVGETVAGQKTGGDLLLLYHIIRCIGLFDDAGVDADVEHTPFAHELGILWQEKGQFGETKRKGNVRFHDGLRVVAPVVLSEEAGWNVDSDHLSIGLVDEVGQCRESSRQRTVQP